MNAPTQTRRDNTLRGTPSRTSLLVAALALLLIPSWLPTIRASEATDPMMRHSLTARSYDGRLWVTGADSAMKQVAMKWANGVIGGVEKVIGEDWRSKNRQLRIRLVETDDDEGRARARLSMSGGRVVHRLTIQNEDRLSGEECDVALCGLLLAGYVIHSEGTSALINNYEHMVESGTVNEMPRWLFKGIAANLEVSRRARNSRIAHEAWQSGQIPMLGAFLDPSKAKKIDRDLANAYAGMVVEWISSFPDREATWKKLLARLYACEPISPEWLVTCIPNCDSVVDLEARWDEWMLRQKRRIFEPGKITGEHLIQLWSLLTVYPGDAGIPMSNEWNQRGDFRNMVEHRKAEWIIPFAENKKLNLRTLALGKDTEFQSVVDAYCRFLDALAGEKSSRRLEKLLDEANLKMRELHATPRTEHDTITVVVPPS